MKVEILPIACLIGLRCPGLQTGAMQISCKWKLKALSALNAHELQNFNFVINKMPQFRSTQQDLPGLAAGAAPNSWGPPLLQPAWQSVSHATGYGWEYGSHVQSINHQTL